MVKGQKFFPVSQVPFAEYGCGIALCFQQFSQGGFGGVQTNVAVGHQRIVNPKPVWVAAG
jgi:hypothetical protein